MRMIFKNSLIAGIGYLLVSLQLAFGTEDDLNVVRQWTSFNPAINRPAFHPHTKRLEIKTTSSDGHGNPTGANIKIYRVEEGQGGVLAGAPEYENNYQLNGEERRFPEETYLGSHQEPFVITFRRYENLIRIGAWTNPNHYNFDLVTDFRVELVGRIQSPGNTIRIFTAPISNIDRNLLQAHTITMKNGSWRDEMIQGLRGEVATLREAQRLDAERTKETSLFLWRSGIDKALQDIHHLECYGHDSASTYGALFMALKDWEIYYTTEAQVYIYHRELLQHDPDYVNMLIESPNILLNLDQTLGVVIAAIQNEKIRLQGIGVHNTHPFIFNNNDGYLGIQTQNVLGNIRNRLRVLVREKMQVYRYLRHEDHPHWNEFANVGDL